MNKTLADYQRTMNKTLADYQPQIDGPGPKSDLEQANDRMNQALLRLEDLLANLENRMTPVLNPVPDQKDGGACPSLERARAPLVAKLEHHASRAESAADFVVVLLSRLCL